MTGREGIGLLGHKKRFKLGARGLPEGWGLLGELAVFPGDGQEELLVFPAQGGDPEEPKTWVQEWHQETWTKRSFSSSFARLANLVEKILSLMSRAEAIGFVHLPGLKKEKKII